MNQRSFYIGARLLLNGTSAELTPDERLLLLITVVNFKNSAIYNDLEPFSGIFIYLLFSYLQNTRNVLKMIRLSLLTVF